MLKQTILYIAAPFVLFLSTSYADTIYVQGGAKDGGNGSQAQPFNMLKQAEQVSKEGDAITILPSETILQDGIVLKDNQVLSGDATVYCHPHQAFNCQIKGGKSMITSQSGDAVTLANNNTVNGITIVKPAGYGIYGKNINNSTIHNNIIQGANAGAMTQNTVIPSPEFRGFFITHIGEKARNGSKIFLRGAIGFLGDGNADLGKLTVQNNIVKGYEKNGQLSGTKGPGIGLFLTGNAKGHITIRDNMVSQSDNVPGILPNYVSGIYVAAFGSGFATALLDSNYVQDLSFNNDGVDFVAYNDGQVYAWVNNYHFRGNAKQGGMSQAIETITGYGNGRYNKQLGAPPSKQTGKIILRVQNSDLSNTAGPGFLMCNPDDNAIHNVIDLGGGPVTQTGTFVDVPSVGRNSITNNFLVKKVPFISNPNSISIIVLNGEVIAKHDWWGKATKKNANGINELNLDNTAVCGVNFSYKLCDGKQSSIITAPALDSNPLQ